MRKFGVFTSFIFITILVAGVYGILHDQITYSISPEYFTKFKYSQFGFEPEWFGGHRPTVAVIGFLATWWMGLFIGVILGSLSFIFPTHKTMMKVLRKAIILVLVISITASIAGFFYGKFYLAGKAVSWWLPEKLANRDAFIIVGSIHNFSYAGGLVGLISGIVYLFKRKASLNPQQKN